jgi:hypothetical protein
MKSSSLPRYVPWIDWEEWLHVYNGCYSEKYEFQKNALEIISLWRLRGKVPHSVESTALILEVFNNKIFEIIQVLFDSLI